MRQAGAGRLVKDGRHCPRGRGGEVVRGGWDSAWGGGSRKRREGGRCIPWPEVSHFDEDAMRELMRQVVDRLYTFQELAENPRLLRLMERWSTVTRHWDKPKMDPVLLAHVEATR